MILGERRERVGGAGTVRPPIRGGETKEEQYNRHGDESVPPRTDPPAVGGSTGCRDGPEEALPHLEWCSFAWSLIPDQRGQTPHVRLEGPARGAGSEVLLRRFQS
jgi:hypothetical protein